MKNRLISIVFFLSFLPFLSCPSASAYWVWSPESGKFVNPEEPVKGTAQEQYDAAMESYKQKDSKKAADRFRILVKKFPTAPVAADGQYRLGILYEEMGDYYKAFRAYRDLLQRYPQSEHLNEVIEREFRIGNLFLSGNRAKLIGLKILPSGPRAVEIFKHITEAAPYSQYGDKAQFHLGLAYKKTNQFEEAIQAFQALLDRYPESPLAPQANFQIADTAYLQSVAAARDQRVMDRATQEIGRFLKRYPDSNVSDKAAKLEQEIDEKNAEKNYRIALYYEKENFLDSAFIYYRDVAKRYPRTQWGEKSLVRLRALERPAEFLKLQEGEVAGKKEKLLKDLEGAGSLDPARRKELEEELKRVQKEEKELKKSKPETLKRRRTGLKQKEKLLQEKWKALEKKQKYFKKNTSEDLARAFKRWGASLEKEKADLVREKIRIQEWEKSLNVRHQPELTEMIPLPFMKEELSPLEQVEQAEAKRLEKLSQENRKLLKQKEELYREYEKLAASGEVEKATSSDNEKSREELEKQLEEIDHLESVLENQRALYKKHFGTSSWEAVLRMPTSVIGKSVKMLTPSSSDTVKDWKSKSPEELKRLQQDGQGKLKTQKALVDTIAQAFDGELARAEEKHLAAPPSGEKTLDATALRRSIKQMEREIRSRYNEIQDRNERKNELLEELDKAMHGEKEEGSGVRTARALSSPVRGFYHLGKDFIFGLPDRGVKLTKEAAQLSGKGVDSEKIQNLRKEIELEGLLISARNQEIEKFEREREALRAQASLAETPHFRSLLVKFPSVFFREAVTSANRLIPKKDRKEKLIEQLNRETAKLEQLKSNLDTLERLIQEKSKEGKNQPEAAVSSETAAEPENATPAKPDPRSLQEEIEILAKQIELKRESYEGERDHFEKARWNRLTGKRIQASSKKLKRIEKGLVHLIEEQQKLQKQEIELLLKKKEVVEHFLTQVPADFYAREFRLQHEKIQSRLQEIQKRETQLTEELKRLRFQSLPAA